MNDTTEVWRPQEWSPVGRPRARLPRFESQLSKGKHFEMGCPPSGLQGDAVRSL